MPGETILVVDDEANIVELARMYLEQEGFRVEEASDGAAALEAISRQVPALMVLDLMLPEVDGWEVCRRVRQSKATPDLPIIMLTARDEDVDKPFNPRELVARIKAILRRAQPVVRAEAPIHVGDVTIDPARREAIISGKAVEENASRILELLAQEHELVFP